MTDKEFKWYILRAITGKERKIKELMLKELRFSKLDQYVNEILIPSEKVYQVRKMKDKSKKIAVEKSFFPGYMLVNANLDHGEVVHTIVNIPNVINFLNVEDKTKGSKPTPIQEEEVNRILGRLQETHQEVKYEETYMVSESVKIIDGPFSGMIGIVGEVFDEKKKLNVMVKIFGRTAPVELTYSQIDKFKKDENEDKKNDSEN